MMLSSKPLSNMLALVLLCSQSTQAFCVYNKLEGDGASFLVFNVIENFGRAFNKEIAQGNNECCPYNNGGCNTGLTRDYPLSLQIRFGFDRISPKAVHRQYTISCEGGAGIDVTGSNFDNIAYTCYKTSGQIITERLHGWVTV